MATIELIKSNENCSNIYFIDENTCAGDSLEIINNNFTVLSSNLIDLSRNFDLWASIFSRFTTTSATIVSTLFNIENINNTVNTAYSCVQTFSGNWVKQFSLYFPTIYDVNDWDIIPDVQKDAQFLNPWLTLNFPPEFFPDYQIVNLFVNTNQSLEFRFTFSRSYEENCAPNGGTTSVSCNGCGSVNQGAYRNAGCNHHGGEAGYGACDNAYTYCGLPTSSKKDSSSFTCIADSGQRLTGSPLGPLQVGLYNVEGQTDNNAHQAPIVSYDTCFARVYSYKYIKTYNEIDGANWNIIL
jgi:hypothetical protein